MSDLSRTKPLLFAGLDHAFTNPAGRILGLPGLRGAWLGAVDATGSLLDQSGNGLTLSRNGGVAYTVVGKALCADFDGATGYLNRADEAALDITGSESYISTADRGLTIGGWWYPDVINSVAKHLISKWNGSLNQRSHVLAIDAQNRFQFFVSSDGIGLVGVPDGVNLPSAGQWYFVVGRYRPSTEMAIFVNRNKTASTTSIPASIYSSTAPFRIGASGDSAFWFDGRAALVFICAAALPDEAIYALYDSTVGLF